MLTDAVEARLERLWYGPRGVAFALLSPVLGPASLAVRGASAWRRSRRRPAPALPTVAVGNLTVGGTGKTQVVLHLAELALGAGGRPAIVTRGYGGSVAGPAVVSPDADALRFGDEPVLLSRRLPGATVVVARDRAAGIELARRRGCDAALLDDGLQQSAVEPGFRIAVVPAERPFGNGALLPLGPLRDPPRALAACDLVWVHGDGDARGLARVDVRSRTRAIGLFDRDGGEVTAAGLRVFAFAGIARPERFFRTLEETGLQVLGSQRFADHRTFGADDLRALEHKAKASGAEALVCTEKDSVRLRTPTRVPLLTLRVGLELIAER